MTEEPALRRREMHNADVIEELSKGSRLAPRERSLLPPILTRGTVLGVPYCIEGMLPGVPFLDLLGQSRFSTKPEIVKRSLRSATDFLLSLPRPTPEKHESARKSRRKATSSKLELLEIFLRWVPEELEGLSRFKGRLLALLDQLDSGLPVVFHHGDYGPQNILVNPDTGILGGVIDWDLAEEFGFPLIDLSHLLVCCRWKAGGISLPEAILSVLFREDDSFRADPAVVAYRQGVAVPPEAFEFLGLMTWVNWVVPHTGTERRSDEPWIEKNVLSFLRSSEVGRWVEETV